ncbi:MAG: hypothetical protein IJD10_02635 [Clostridia bacterium]|nr:hypothetical protein [Clostridia bacterium]
MCVLCSLSLTEQLKILSALKSFCASSSFARNTPELTISDMCRDSWNAVQKNPDGYAQ